MQTVQKVILDSTNLTLRRISSSPVYRFSVPPTGNLVCGAHPSSAGGPGHIYHQIPLFPLHPRAPLHLFTLTHHNLSLSNIIVDPATQMIMGIVSWECTGTQPG